MAEAKGNAAAKGVTMKTIAGDLKADQSGKYEFPIEVSIFKERQAFGDQEIEIRDGFDVVATGKTDARGIFIVVLKGDLTDAEQSKRFRVCLVGSPDEVVVPVSLPKKGSLAMTNDPESLSMFRYHDGNGHFHILARVLNARGAGLVASLTSWFRGVRADYQTDENGIVDFVVPADIAEGDNDEFSMMVSGIKDRAKIRIRRRGQVGNFRDHAWWPITTNNGRAMIMCLLCIIIWSIMALKAIGTSTISSDLFRDESAGLSAAESFYNQSAALTDSSAMIAAHHVSPMIPNWMLVFVLAFTFFTIVYSILAWREEIMLGIEEGIEAIVDKDHARIDDPILEKWLTHFGIKGMANVRSSGEPSPKAEGGHPSLGTLFQLDLLSDVLVGILPMVLKNIFGSRE